MKKFFLIGVIAYSATLLLLQHWPNAIGENGIAAAPWMVLMLVDGAFAITALIKIFGVSMFEDEEEVGIHPDDVNVPDAYFYGLFGLNLLANFGWHCYKFAVETGAAGFGYSLWFLVEAAAIALTIIFYRHALQVAKREARKAYVASGGKQNIKSVA